MNWIDFIIIAVILVVIGGAMTYIILEKKRGRKCIGCPYSASCGSRQDACHCKDIKNNT